MSDLIFHDPTGKRAKRAGMIGGLTLAALAALTGVFFFSLAFLPGLPGANLRNLSASAALHPEYRGKEIAWAGSKRHAFKPVDTPTGRPLVVAFMSGEDANGGARASLRRHISQIDVLAPQWLFLKNGAGELNIISDPQVDAIYRDTKEKRPALIPLIANSAGGVWNTAAVARLLKSPVTRAKLIDTLRNLAQQRGYAGYMFDFEELDDESQHLYPGFIEEARRAFSEDGRQTWVTTPFDDKDWPLKALQAASDMLVVMAYDEHDAESKAGPPAGQGWYESNLERLTKLPLDPGRTILALGAYGYDWNGSDPADSLTFQEATEAASNAGAKIDFDSSALNSHFSYVDQDQTRHDVWLMDALSMFNEIQVADSWGPKGYAFWRIGSEDPGIWSLLGKPYGQATTEGLSTVEAGLDVDFVGGGEILHVTGQPRAGHRNLTIEPKSELISGVNYDKMPGAYVIQRYSSAKKVIALTFDDGPDKDWTAQILDILKAKHAPATFFVIGENMERMPELVEREVAEGHEVGNHTYTHPNIAQVPDAAALLELSATQTLFQTVTGRSMRLFRPPYFGDAEPATPDEVRPLVLAERKSFITVGLRIDTDDWLRPPPDKIIQRVTDQLDNPVPDQIAQVVLLHDSGGDRSNTVKALPGLIDAIRARGFTLVPISAIAGKTTADVMPMANRNPLLLSLDRFAFLLVRNFERFVNGLMMTAIVLGLVRFLFMFILAIAHRLGEDRRRPADLDPAEGPMISVLIPCFNEEKVIVQSIARILASHWTKLEILVLDDGSKDGTAKVVEDAYAGEPRVRLLKFQNGGKARALNQGLELAQGEIIVALDADTLFPPETLGALARWFANPKIGAVAGNALVGNRVNLVTRWQALEYVVAQNLERRALAALGAVTVVPGAVGAWRKAALTDLGGYPTDTLAEDQDLTIAIQRKGWIVTFDPDARAYTEAPDTFGDLMKQRFRWSFGTLQCLWKHRDALFDVKLPILGFVALPQVWLFQIVLTTAAPLVDLAMIWSIVSAYMTAVSHPVEWSNDDLIRTGFLWTAFVLLDLAAGSIGMALERRAPWAELPWLPLQRFGYRQMMYYVVVKAVRRAIDGSRVGWGKLERKATVSVDSPSATAKPGKSDKRR